MLYRKFLNLLPTLSAFIVLVGVIVLYLYSENQANNANILRRQSMLLADELRQSSDDLTRMVRTYVTTGDPIYKQHYQEILNIRNGKIPRPVKYEDIYWDLVLEDDQRPRPRAESDPLLERMRRAGFTDAEFARLEEAKANSDLLVSTEYAAMALIESTDPITDANRLKAIEMLNNSAYHHAKADIMAPINEFYQMMARRTQKVVHVANYTATLLRIVFIAFTVIWVLTLYVFAARRKKAEKEQEMLKAHLGHQQKLESIGTLAGGVAHEINNPINGIMNYAQLISDRLDPESPLREYSEGIGKETERVSEIVRNLLSFARQDNQSHSPEDISNIVEDTVSLISTIIRKDQITLNVYIPDDIPKLKCRSQQIQQVIMNLLTNSRDALNKRFPEYDEDKAMSVKVRSFEKKDRHWFRISVEDHGIGISNDIRARIFDPFFTTKDRTEGTGLGLSISLGIVQDHHGELSFESKPGQYTRFHLDLPADNGWDLSKIS